MPEKDWLGEKIRKNEQLLLATQALKGIKLDLYYKIKVFIVKTKLRLSIFSMKV